MKIKLKNYNTGHKYSIGDIVNYNYNDPIKLKILNLVYENNILEMIKKVVELNLASIACLRFWHSIDSYMNIYKNKKNIIYLVHNYDVLNNKFYEYFLLEEIYIS